MSSSTANGNSPAPQNSTALDISSQVDHSEITIGDRVQYEIKVIYPADGHLELPSVLGNLGAFEVKDYQASDPKPSPSNSKQLEQTWQFNLSTFTVGKYTLPPQQIAYRQGQDTAATIYYTQPIEINVIRSSPETVKDIADIAPLAEVRGGQPWLAYGLGALVIFALALFLWKRYGKKLMTKPEKPPIPPFEAALEALARLKGLHLIRENRAREFCFQLSEILRRYISHRFSIDAMESTTTEFLKSASDLSITLSQKEWLGKFCEITDQVKYADGGLLETKAQELIKETEDFIRQIKATEVVAEKVVAADGPRVTGIKPK